MEARCPACKWEGFWDDAECTVTWQKYGEAFGSPASKPEYFYHCPLCGTRLEEIDDQEEDHDRSEEPV